MQPPIITENDVKDPQLLLRQLRKMVQHVGELEGRLAVQEQRPTGLTLSQIRQALSAYGSHPLNITGLLGQAAQPQPANTTLYSSVPSGQLLQSLRDGQLVVVAGSSGSADGMYRVVGGNPNTLVKILSSTSANTAFTDVANTFSLVQTLQNGLTVTGGQFDSVAQYSAMVWTSTGTNVTAGGVVSPSFGTADYNQGSVYAAGTPDRLSAQDTGIYVIGGQATYYTTSTSTAQRRITIRMSAATVLQDVQFIPILVTGSTFYSVSLPAVTKSMSSTDYIEMRVTNGSTSTSETVGGTIQTFMYMHKVC